MIFIMKYLRRYKGNCFVCKKEISYISKKHVIRSKRLCSLKCRRIKNKEIIEFKEDRGPITCRFQILDL